jgi:hypothetical protein
MIDMARVTTRKTTQTEQLWEKYRSLQLSPEQKKAAREETEARVEQARIDGVYERVRETAGTVKWSISWRDLRNR